MIRVKTFLQKKLNSHATPMPMYCNNDAVIFIANNPVFYKRTKHIEVDSFYKSCVKVIFTHYTKSEDQLTDIFTKPLAKKFFTTLVDKLGMISML